MSFLWDYGILCQAWWVVLRWTWLPPSLQAGTRATLPEGSPGIFHHRFPIRHDLTPRYPAQMKDLQVKVILDSSVMGHCCSLSNLALYSGLQNPVLLLLCPSQDRFEPTVSAAYQSGKGQHCHFHRRKDLARTKSSRGDHIITIWIRTFLFRWNTKSNRRPTQQAYPRLTQGKPGLRLP